MYNEERKNRFMNEYSSSDSFSRSVKVIFDWTEPYETLNQQDLCELNKEVLNRIISDIAVAPTRTAQCYISIVQRYIEWCQKEGFSTDPVEICRDYSNLNTIMVNSPTHLKQTLDKFFPIIKHKKAQKYGTFNCLYRTICWLAFMGITKNDAENLKCNSVDFEDMMIGFNGRGFKIYEESVFDLDKCVHSEVFFQQRVGTRTKKTGEKTDVVYNTLLPRAKSNYVLRGRTDQKPSVTLNTLVLSQPYVRFKELEKTGTPVEIKRIKKVLTYSNLYNSGIYYRMYIQEKRGVEVDFSDIAAYDAMKKPRSKNGEAIQKSKSNYLYKYRHGYEEWKKAFGLD